MQQSVEQAVTDTLGYLMRVTQEGARPDAAKSGLREVQQRHSSIDLQLIWEEEAFDQSVHYDALLSIPESGTISLSYCDYRAKPWPLRGVQRWSEKDLLRVNNTVMQVDQAIACMDFIWDETRIVERLVNACLLQEELEKNPIPISNQELQLAMDRFRKARKLHKAEDTYRWMERRGVSYESLERLVEGQALLTKLRDKVVGNRVEEYFDTNSAQFDTTRVARFLVADETSALDMCRRIRSGEIDFLQAAQNHFITAKQSRPPKIELFTTIQRREASPELRESLFQSEPGSILGPVREENGYVILRVLSMVRATLDDATRDAIKNILFEEWLEKRRRTASIEWLWGNASNTGKETRTDLRNGV
jgi:putative peptide maturation system protein